MKKNRYILVVGIILIGMAGLIFVNNKLDNKETKLDKVKLKENKVDNKSFAIMIQKEDKTGYKVYEGVSWPTEGYEFNSELSGCIDNYGSIIENSLTYDNTTNKVTIKTGVTSSCYVYFDIENNSLGQYLIDNSISGLDKTIIEGDTLYRFSGTNGNTGINNYICLGTTSKCTSGSENMYRIIGVEPNTGYVKVTKQTQYGEKIVWNSSTGVTWLESAAYSAMKTWYNSVAFKNMIVEHTWAFGDILGKDDSYIGTRENVLNNENTTTSQELVGTLAVSDYYLAYRGDQNWYNKYDNYTDNWLHFANNENSSDYEWFMSRFTTSSSWLVINSGRVGSGRMSDYPSVVRPVFYLNSNVFWKEGTGISEDPFIVELKESIITTVNNNNSINATITISSNETGTYCVNTSSTITDMNNCVFNGNITKDSPITTNAFTTGGDYYVHVKDSSGNIGISSKVTIILGIPLGEYLIDNSVSGLDKNFIGTDTLYRFSGTSGNTGINNYICLGTTSKCASESDNMYRIIGVEPSTGYVKIIKQTKYGSNIPWNTNNSPFGIEWTQTSSYNAILNWYNSVSFKNMIVSHTLNIGAVLSTSNDLEDARVLLINVEDNSTANSYVGIISLTDYFMAYKGNQNWNKNYSNYTDNWIHLANNGNTTDHEWTMTWEELNNAWAIINTGMVSTGNTGGNIFAVRPTFFLDSDVNRISGSGTSTDPFIVSK